MAPRKKSRNRPGKRKRAPARLSRHTGWDSARANDLLIAEWSRSRAGGRAARGYHFQDAVGAWLAVRIATGQLIGELVPEGFDDMTVEGDPSNNHQVKSRADHLGPFSPPDAAKHIFDALEADRRRPVPADTVTVVLERGVASDEVLADAAGSLEDVLITGSPLQEAIARVASTRDVAADDLLRFLRRTVLLGPTWTDLDDRTDALLGGLTSVPPAALGVLRRALCAAVARATDINGSAHYDERARLTRTGLIAAVADTAELIDVAGLEGAISAGICIRLLEADPSLSEALNLDVGGRGTGRHVSLAQYVGQNLSRQIRGDRAHLIEGVFMSNELVRRVVYRRPGGEEDVVSSLAGTDFDMALFRLREPG